MKKFIIYLSLLTGFILAMIMCQAQTISQPINYKRSEFVDLGLGWGGQGTAFNLHLTSQIYKDNAVTLGVNATFTGNVLGAEYNSKEALTLFAEYGKIIKTRGCIMKLSAGPSYVHVARYGSEGGFLGAYVDEKKSTVGIQNELQIIPAWKAIGAGITVFLNVNPEYTFGGLTFNLAFGNVHFRKRN